MSAPSWLYWNRRTVLRNLAVFTAGVEVGWCLGWWLL